VTFDDALRPMIAEMVRAEVARVLAERERTDDEGFMSTTDAARYAGVALGTIRRWIREGKLPEHHAGRHLRVRRADLDGLLVGERRERELSPEELARRHFGG
jgi:excisionase family DNA binding protein